MRLWLLASVVLGMLPGLSVAQSNCRLYLVSQYDWGSKAGFYADLEGPKLADLPLILGVADGTDWRFKTIVPPFVPDRDYVIGVTIGGERSELTLDGQPAIAMDVPWRPASQSLFVNDKPAWANEPGDWRAVISRVTVAVTRGGQKAFGKDFDFSASAARPAPLQFFEPGFPQSSPLPTQPGDTLTAEVRLRFVSSDLRPHAPFIDRFGQAIHADYPGKVKDETELRADLAAEDAELAKLPPSPDFDEYGGYTKAGWTEEGTGFFRVLRREGKWWLITPAGNPCFLTGVCAAPQQTWETTPITDREYLYEWLPPREGEYAGAWSRNAWGVTDGTEYACFYACNLVRKYGPDWIQKANERALRRLASWGFQGGKWGSPAEVSQTPVLGTWEWPKLKGHVDVFDPAAVALVAANLRKQMEPRLRDPRVIGWSIGNEYDEIIKRAEVREILALGAEVPAKRALVDEALNALYGGDVAKLVAAWKAEAGDVAGLHAAQPTPPDEDVEKLRCFYEDRYYATLYQTVKAIDPNHLYLGNWIVPGWWESEEDWRIVARHCDVIGYDRYALAYADELLPRLQAETDKPTLCGEFGLPAWYDGMRGFGRYGVYTRDEDEAGRLYQAWVRDAARNPHCVGLIWFLYRDQPLTGRGPGRGEALVYGEHFAFGLVTEQDRVKWPLVRQMREANQQAAGWRMGR